MAAIIGMFIFLYMYHMFVYAITDVNGEYSYKRSMILSAGISIFLWLSGFTDRAFGLIDF